MKKQKKNVTFKNYDTLRLRKCKKYVLKVEFSLHKIAFCKGYAYKITI